MQRYFKYKIDNDVIYWKMLMKKFYLYIQIFLFYLILASPLLAKQSDFLKKGIELYKSKKFAKSKIFLERSLVYDPKSEESYLYLAKIFKHDDNQEEEEINLNNALLINPSNDEALYMLVILKIKQSDYETAKELIDKFALVCKSYCSKKKEIEDKLKKFTTENAKDKN